MTALILDAGNTSVKIVRWDCPVSFCRFSKGRFVPALADNHPAELGVVPTDLHVENPREFLDRILEFSGNKDEQVVLVSVVPGVEKLLGEIWPEFKVVGLSEKLPFAHEIKQPETVGPDRFCNMACAVASGMTSALVVDAGTATTFDLLLDGVFKGGLIAPGMEFAARQMALKGAMLSETIFEPRPPVVGKDTRAAMMGGAWLTGFGGVEWTLARLLETYGPVPVVLTGGLAAKLAAEGRFLAPHWTLRGAAFLAGLGQ